MIYLASASPRRRELLSQIGIKFELLLVDVDESIISGELADDYVARVATLKAQTAANKASDQTMAILAADTSVIDGNNILGKPRDKADAINILAGLSGKTHQVKTAISVAFNGGITTEVITTDVTFRAISRQEIEQYWATGEPQDKAGAYGIQGIGGKFVEKINGSYSSVVGLPLMETEQLLNKVLQST